MKTGERERLVNRIRQMRRVGKSSEAPSSGESRDPSRAQLVVLENRIAHLEQLLEGLQDSVYRESDRQEKRLTDLETRTQPAALGEALSKDARERGL